MYNKFCDWCDGGAADLVYSKENEDLGGEIVIEERKMIFYANDKEASREINFCPMCGRPIRIQDGDIVRHFKGGLYRVINMDARDYENPGFGSLVVYKSMDTYQTWVRNLHDFMSEAPEESASLYRFERVDDDD